MTSPGTHEAAALARVRWLEEVPPTNLAAWLHLRLQHTGVKPACQTVRPARHVWFVLRNIHTPDTLEPQMVK